MLFWMALSRPGLAQARGAGVEVSLHARTTQASARAERAAWLSVTLPISALMRPSVRPAALAEAASAPEPTASTPAPAEPTEPELSFRALRAFADFSRRASRVAFSVRGVAAERRRLDSLAIRARVSAALPELRLRAQRNTDQALRWAPTSDDPYRVTQADGAGTTLEASATFRLDRLLFADEELSIERERRQAGEQHLELERSVLEALLALFRARQLGCSPGIDEAARAEQLIRVAERFTELDALTAGWFAEHAPSFARAIWGFPEAILGACQAPAPASEAPSTKPVASLQNSG
jgi:hypothetical protein